VVIGRSDAECAASGPVGPGHRPSRVALGSASEPAQAYRQRELSARWSCSVWMGYRREAKEAACVNAASRSGIGVTLAAGSSGPGRRWQFVQWQPARRKGAARFRCPREEETGLRSLVGPSCCRFSVLNPVRTIVSALIRGYQLLVSPLLPPSCRFYPTCSEYAREAVMRHGAWRGLGLAARRMLRCHPRHPGGFDPVP